MYVSLSVIPPFPPCLPPGDSAFPQAPSLKALVAAFVTHPYTLPHHREEEQESRAPVIMPHGRFCLSLAHGVLGQGEGLSFPDSPKPVVPVQGKKEKKRVKSG